MVSERRAFTLVELLVVISIIGTVSALGIGATVWSMADMAMTGAASDVQAALMTARDAAAKYGIATPEKLTEAGQGAKPASIHGIRLIPDAALPGCYGSWVESHPAPNYSEGLVSIRPGMAYPSPMTGGRPCLVLEQSAISGWTRDDDSGKWSPTIATPTYWSQNIRLGERVRVGHTGTWYTVMGPASTDGSDVVQCLPFSHDYIAPDGVTVATYRVEYLLLCNGQDDDRDGIADNGWDGIDNDGDGVADEPDECEPERWAGKESAGVERSPYAIRRRPYPVTHSPVINLPRAVVIDGTRSAIPGAVPGQPVDVMVHADGTLAMAGRYTVPTSLPMGESPLSLFLCNRADFGADRPQHAARIVELSRNGRVATSDPSDSSSPRSSP